MVYWRQKVEGGGNCSGSLVGNAKCAGVWIEPLKHAQVFFSKEQRLEAQVPIRVLPLTREVTLDKSLFSGASVWSSVKGSGWKPYNLYWCTPAWEWIAKFSEPSKLHRAITEFFWRLAHFTHAYYRQPPFWCSTKSLSKPPSIRALIFKEYWALLILSLSLSQISRWREWSSSNVYVYEQWVMTNRSLSSWINVLWIAAGVSVSSGLN